MQGDKISTVGDNINTVESIQYSGVYLQHGGGYLQYNKDLKYYEFSKNFKIFFKLILLRNQIDQIAGLNC